LVSKMAIGNLLFLWKDSIDLVLTHNQMRYYIIVRVEGFPFFINKIYAK
jgi:hypothetical protein